MKARLLAAACPAWAAWGWECERRSDPLDKLIVPASGIRFGDMTGRQKSIFAVNLVCCICTMGFVFPNVMLD